MDTLNDSVSAYSTSILTLRKMSALWNIMIADTNEFIKKSVGDSPYSRSRFNATNPSPQWAQRTLRRGREGERELTETAFSSPLCAHCDEGLQSRSGSLFAEGITSSPSE
jgi:hypothetical protein